VPSHKLESKVESIRSSASVASAKGKLGVMIPGMGAVATTFVAGVEAVRKGLALPIGSLTQMGTIRLGKRTEGVTPRIKEFLPLAGLEDLVFTGWDIFEDDMYEAASKAGVLEQSLGEGEAVSSGDQASVRGLRPPLREATGLSQCQEGAEQNGLGAAGPLRHLRFQEIIRRGAAGDDLVRVDRNISEAIGCPRIGAKLRDRFGAKR
jgi:Myo-inositol-1-phosphate synthase